MPAGFIWTYDSGRKSGQRSMKSSGG